MKATAKFNSRNIECGKTYEMTKRKEDTVFMEDTVVLEVKTPNGVVKSFCYGESDFKYKWDAK